MGRLDCGRELESGTRIIWNSNERGCMIYHFGGMRFSFHIPKLLKTLIYEIEVPILIKWAH